MKKSKKKYDASWQLQRKGFPDLKNSIVVASFNSIIVLLYDKTDCEENIEKESVKKNKREKKSMMMRSLQEFPDSF